MKLVEADLEPVQLRAYQEQIVYLPVLFPLGKDFELLGIADIFSLFQRKEATGMSFGWLLER